MASCAIVSCGLDIKFQKDDASAGKGDSEEVSSHSVPLADKAAFQYSNPLVMYLNRTLVLDA